jgi:hypothetical protein
MIISSQGEACGPNDDIKALDLNGTNALRDRLRKIQASSGSGEAALLARAEIELENDKKAELAKIEEAKHALQDFRSYLAQSSDKAARALPNEEELEYNYNPETKECEITRLDGQDIVLNLIGFNLQGELPLPFQLMVTMLFCTGNELTVLPELPASLTMLSCSRNQLTILPELPASLAQLECSQNKLTALPELPDSLTQLYCGENQLTTLPELPASLTDLFCHNNQLTTLPRLPNSLTYLNCNNNQLTTLPVLPDSLIRLNCYNNQLTALPELPASLIELWCDHNQLTYLPELPASLTDLDCLENPGLASDPATQAALKTMAKRGCTVKS